MRFDLTAENGWYPYRVLLNYLAQFHRREYAENTEFSLRTLRSAVRLTQQHPKGGLLENDMTGFSGIGCPNTLVLGFTLLAQPSSGRRSAWLLGIPTTQFISICPKDMLVVKAYRTEWGDHG